MSAISCKTCKRTSCGDAGRKRGKYAGELEQKAANCPIGHKAGPGAVNPPGHNMREATHLEGFKPPSDKELAKAARQNAFLKR
jgi:hypothetical protein